jgi:glycosyltransferase involved in cell wall biosynthesis
LIDCIIIIGDGPEKKYLYNLCEKLNIKNRVKFKGKILDEEILKEEFHKSLATIHPQQAGLSVLHSFSYGVPFITSRNSITGGEADNINNNFTGILYGGSIDQLKDIIIDIDSNPTKYHKMGFNAYKYYMSSRTMNNMVKNYYDSILNLS